MHIKEFPSGPFQTNAYVVSAPDERQAIIIDPAPFSEAAISKYLSEHELTPILIAITHSHWDHTADAYSLKKTYSVPVWIHPLDSPNLQNPGTDGLPCMPGIKGVVPDKMLQEGDSIHLGNDVFTVIWTPGHTPGGICLYCKEKGILFSGDTLFKGTIGNISFPTAQPDLMWDSLKKLSKLPPDTRVYPGHGPTTRIGDEDWLPNARQFFGR